jgi:hypothetical protein
MQDILNCMLLSESVYKAYESGPEAAAQAFRDFQQGFAPGLITVHSLQCSLPHVQQRCPRPSCSYSILPVTIACISNLTAGPQVPGGCL